MGRSVANSYDLSGKTAVVTGGGRGIGRAIAECLADSGAKVCIWDERPGSFPSVRSEIVDVTDADQVTTALARVLGHTTRLDIVVNNAGYLGLLNAFDKHERNDWWKIIQVNLIGMMNVAQAVVPHMREAGGGRIINMGSLAGKEGLAHLAAYSAASAGVIAFTKALGREVVKDNIFVNCVAPGPIETDMIRGLGREAVEQMISDSPMKRLAR
jgi:NAD(P)-dependent dehydrogenase (short-subunit alcohol dehydrogenase family)